MKKILASILTIAMILTTLSTCVIPASAQDAAVATSDILFVEDFQGYGEGNWLSSMVEGKDIVDSSKVSGMKASEWTIYGGQYRDAYYTAEELASKGASVEVIADPADTSNKVLKIAAGDLAGNGWVRVRRNANGESKIARKDIPGKTMIIKADFKVPTGFNISGDTAAFTYDRNAKVKGLWMAGTSGAPMANYGGREWPMLSIDAATYQSNYNTKATQYVDADKWFEVKYVIDMTEHKTENHPADTYRGFYNGSVYSAQMKTYAETNKNKNVLNSKFPQPAAEVGGLSEKVYDSWGGYAATPTDTTFVDFGDFYGATMTVSGKDGGAYDYLYMDNLQVYYVDDFKQEGEATYEKADNGIWYAGEIRIPFNNDLMTEVKENNVAVDYTSIFTLKDAEGNVVEGGITKAYADGNELVIVPSKKIERLKPYTVWASPLFMDAEGQGLNQFSKEQAVCTFDTAVDPYAHIIYDFDFEDYDIDDKDWIENVDSNRYVTSSGVEEGTISINKNASASDNHKITVVADPKNPDNKVLALSAGYEKPGYVTQLRFNANGKAGLSRSTDMGKGKKLVYKTKIFIPIGFLPTESSQLVNTASEGQNSANVTSGIGGTMTSGLYIATTGTWGTLMARQQMSTGEWLGGNEYRADGQWIEWKHVADVSKPLSATHSDTVRAYINDKLVVTEFVGTNGKETPFGDNEKYGHNIKNAGDRIIDMLPAGGDLFKTTDYASIGSTWWGSAFNINPQSADTSKGDTFYLDDVEAFWIDALTFNTINADDYTGGKVKINFNQKIREEVTYVEGKTYSKANTKVIGLDGLFTIVDKDTKEVIEDAVGKVTLSADGKSVSVTPNTAVLEKGKDYSIRISEYLIDEYGQGLENNSTATYVNLHISTEVAPAFALEEISQTEVSGFAQGRDVKVTAKFNIAVDDESLTNGIVVKAEDGTVIARNEGWTADYGTDKDGNIDYKTVVFDFGSLPTANYEVSANENFLATNGSELSTALSIAINKANDRIVLFEEDFETGYTLRENWLTTANAENATAAGVTGGKSNFRTADGKWDIQTNSVAVSTDDFVGVISADDITEEGLAFTSNVLKIEENGATTYSHALGVRRNFDIGAISLNSGEYAGKRLIYEADIYCVPKVLTNTSANGIAVHGMKVSRQATKVYEYDNSGWKNVFTKGGNFRIQEGGYAGGNYGPIFTFQTAITTTPLKGNKMRIVVDQSTEKDTMRMYIDGVLQSKAYGNYLDGHELNGKILADAGDSQYNGRGSNLGDTLYGIWNSGVDSVMYIDNFKAYLVDNFVVESVEGNGDVFNTAKGAVTFTFSKPVDEATVAGNVVLLDAEGNEVAGGIRLAEVSDAGYKLTVRLADTLPGKTTYTVKLKDGLLDVDGLNISLKYYDYNTYDIDAHYTKNANGNYDITIVSGKNSLDVECIYTPRTETTPATLKRASDGKYETYVDCFLPDYKAMKTEVEITTSKATSLFAEATVAAIDGNTVKTTVKFTNPEVIPMGVWCVVAAFGEYNEMLGCTPVEKTVDPSSTTEAEEITVEVANGNAVKSIKMFVWDSYTDMKPYQKAEDIYNK